MYICLLNLRAKCEETLCAVLWAKSKRLRTRERLARIESDVEFLHKLCNHYHAFNLTKATTTTKRYYLQTVSIAWCSKKYAFT